MPTLALHGSSIEIAPGALATLGERIAARHPGKRIAIIADQQVGQHYAAKTLASILASGLALGQTVGGTVAPGVFSFPAGEQHKTRETWAKLSDQLIAAGHRRDSVFLYPVRTTAEKQRELFVAMLERANGLAERPEFYNTLWSSCTTNIVSHINDIAPRRVPLSFKVLLPGYSDELAYDLGLLDTDLPRESFRLPHLINARAAQFADREDFSRPVGDECIDSQGRESNGFLRIVDGPGVDDGSIAHQRLHE